MMVGLTPSFRGHFSPLDGRPVRLGADLLVPVNVNPEMYDSAAYISCKKGLAVSASAWARAEMVSRVGSVTRVAMV